MADNSDAGDYEVKKGRGRPKKTDTKAAVVVVEDSKVGEKRSRGRPSAVHKEDKKPAGDGEPVAKRGRGRPKGTKKGKAGGRTKSPAKGRTGRGRGRPKKDEPKADSEEGSGSEEEQEEEEDDEQE